jgi:NADH-ubiquinone oxidoreductase chain 4
MFFESRLIPTLFLILGWVYQPEHVQAGVYLLYINAPAFMYKALFTPVNNAFFKAIFLCIPVISYCAMDHNEIFYHTFVLCSIIFLNIMKSGPLHKRESCS